MPDLSQLAQLHFMRPWWLLGIPIIIVFFKFFKKERDPIDKWAPIIAPHLARAMLVGGGRGHWFNPSSVGTVMMIICLLALSGPTWERQPSPFVEDKAVLVIALDLSGSMNQSDVQPSRLERAKQKIEDLLKLRAGARTGLVVYAGSAHSVIPLTNDPDIVRNFLAAVVPEMMPRNGKFAEKALPIADRMLRDSEIPGTILVVADAIGPETEPAYREYFASNDNQLLVLGIGKAAGDEGLGDADIPLQRETLESLASATDGYYQDLSLDSSDIERINRRINNHLLNVEDSNRPWVDFGYYLLFPIALIYALWFRKGWTLQWGLALVLALGIGTSPNASAADKRFIDLWLTADQQGRYYFERGDYGTAAQRFQDIAWRGVAFYLDENFEAAGETFSQIETPEGLFNLANAWAQSQNYVYAVRTYDQLLELEPEYPGAQKNRDIVQGIIDDINRMSESQQSEPGSNSEELGDEPLRAEGAEKQEWGKKEVVQLSADEILADDSIRDMWLRQVQQDPSVFLSIKFMMQLEQGDTSETP